jgi:formiminotetrahydrofolate cyclodeaminase
LEAFLLDQSATIEAFLAATAAKQPTPGGGSVAALTGALAAAAAEMVLSYSVGKKDLASYQVELSDVQAHLKRARQLFTTLMAEDQAAFLALSAARKLPVEAPHRTDEIAATLGVCLSVPQTIAATALAVLELCDRVWDKSNKFLLSDLAVASDLAMATVRCAIHNVRVNLTDVVDASRRTEIEKSNQYMMTQSLAIIQKLSRRFP